MIPDTLYWDADASAHPPDSDPAQADAEIQPLLWRINEVGAGWMDTVQSCAGHPERGEPGYAAPEVWVRLFNPDPAFTRLFKWIERATRIRQSRSPVKADRLIDVYFLGWYQHGAYFSVCGRYIDPQENARIRQALLDALTDPLTDD